MNYGENTECLLEGMRAIFEYIGGVPVEIWFDNTSTIVTQIIKGGGRQITDRFRLFCEHYRFKSVFMNPDAGHEKGSVESKVGYLRRNELVPIPEFQSLAAKNQNLLTACDEDMQREHYDKGRMISELFEEDRAALIPLPSIRFDTAGYGTAKTDKYGRFTLDEGMHRYSASPAFCEKIVQYKLTSGTVTVMDSDMHEIVTHRRLYGEDGNGAWHQCFACAILDCSRQNIDDLMRRDKLHLIRTDAKYKLFSKAEVMQRRKD